MATYKVIAERAGVSIGTVYRVLRNKGRFSIGTAERVRRVADSLGYTPNIYASNLKRGKARVFGVLLPEPTEDNGYWAEPLRGIQDAVAQLSTFRIDLAVHAYTERSPESFTEQWYEAIGRDHDGLIIAGSTMVMPGRYLESLSPLTARAYIDTEIADDRRLAFVGQDSHASGRVAGRLVSLLAADRRRIVAVRTLPGTKHINDRIDGLSGYLEPEGWEIVVVDLDVTGTTVDVARIAAELEDAPSALFVSNSAGSLVLDALARLRAPTGPTVGYDLVPANVSALRAGRIDFLLNQRPYDQGYRAAMALHRAVVLGNWDRRDEILPVDIVTVENVDGYLDR